MCLVSPYEAHTEYIFMGPYIYMHLSYTMGPHWLYQGVREIVTWALPSTMTQICVMGSETTKQLRYSSPTHKPHRRHEPIRDTRKYTSSFRINPSTCTTPTSLRRQNIHFIPFFFGILYCAPRGKIPHVARHF